MDKLNGNEFEYIKANQLPDWGNFKAFLQAVKLNAQKISELPEEEYKFVLLMIDVASEYITESFDYAVGDTEELNIKLKQTIINLTKAKIKYYEDSTSELTLNVGLERLLETTNFLHTLSINKQLDGDDILIHHKLLFQKLEYLKLNQKSLLEVKAISINNNLKSTVSPPIIENPYPEIFSSTIGYEIFQEMHTIYQKDKIKDLANYSFLFSVMRDKKQNDNVKYIICRNIDFINHLRTIDVDIVKIDSNKSISDSKFYVYESIRNTIIQKYEKSTI